MFKGPYNQVSRMDERIYSLLPSPLGWIGMAATARGMIAITVPRPTARLARCLLREMIGERIKPGENEHIRTTRNELVRYLQGDVSSDFGKISLDLSGHTSFQIEVWKRLREIPRGETRTYLQIARLVGRPKAYRAVGQCNSKNPWAIVVPCHRLIGVNAELTGYGGGLGMKRRLLELEGIDVTALRAMKLAAARRRRVRNAHRD